MALIDGPPLLGVSFLFRLDELLIWCYPIADIEVIGTPLGRILLWILLPGIMRLFLRIAEFGVSPYVPAFIS